jgi:hypothetical protein
MKRLSVGPRVSGLIARSQGDGVQFELIMFQVIPGFFGTRPMA